MNPTRDFLNTTMLAFQKLGHDMPLFQFVLEHGRTFRAQPLPSGFRRGVPKECFNNALNLVIDDAGNERGLVYCEGYAFRPGLIPVHHGWCCDMEGNVIDNTWDDSEQCHYLGIPFNMRFICEMTLKLEHAGVLDCHDDDWRLERGKYPVAEWQHPLALMLPAN